MDAAEGSKKIMGILGFALLLGIPVVAFNPAYRQAFLAILHGTPAESPIWRSNLDYYPDVALPSAPADEAGAPAGTETSHDAE